MKSAIKAKYPDEKYERALRKDYEYIAGVDEAGRGCLAGPVIAAAVVLPAGVSLPGLNDSKKLSEKQREALYCEIIKRAVCYGLGEASPETIDKINILQATMAAMKAAVLSLDPRPDFLLVDGNYFHNIGVPHRTIVGGDAKSASIAAASIVAKVTRDRRMAGEEDALYPEYGFASHKGYGTKKHFQAISRCGLCPIHRKSFLKKYFDRGAALFDAK